MMQHRSKQKAEKERSAESEGQVVDKKINELRCQIQESRSKLDAYLGVISSQVGQIVSHRLNKFVALHSEILQEKEHEIKALEEHNHMVKSSQAGSNLEKLMKTIAHYEAEIQRVNTIKEMFRKESEKFKIEMEIRDRELDACKKREKQLMRQIWVLEEDIKDIYLAETISKASRADQRFKTPIANPKNRTQPHERNRTASHFVPTEPTEVDANDLRIRLEDRFSGYKAGLHMGATRLREKFSISSQEKRVSSGFKLNTPSLYASPLKKSVRPHSQDKDADIYEDIRTNLRKASRIKETQSQMGDDDQRALKAEDFRAICLYGPKIMQQIEGIVLEKYGQLREVDESSIGLLNCLFKAENAIKILEIVLFSYSVQAITHIHDHRRQLASEIAYDQPALDSEPPAPTVKPRRIKMEKELRKKFKNSIIQRTSELSAHRLDQ